MKKRRLGRTGLEASVVGFGGAGIMSLGKDSAVKVVRGAFDLGINYFDTARSYGDSEEKMGLALETVRDRCVLATKVHLRTRGEAETLVKHSLHYLKTNRIDIVQVHVVDSDEDLGRVLGPDGVFETLKEAKAKGNLDFIGITSHYPSVLIQAIRTGEFDVVQVPLNIVTRHAADELIPLARKENIGVVVMKPFGAMGSIEQCPEFKALFGVDKNEIACTALRYLLAHDVATVIPGFLNLDEVEAAVKTAEGFKELTTSEREELEARPREPYCRSTGTLNVCKLCMPCPELLEIPTILRLFECSRTYGLRNWGKNEYQRLSVKADRCTRCGECEPRCPYTLPVQEMLRESHRTLLS